MNIKNLKIGTRLIIGFSVILALIVSISIISLFKLSTINDSADELTGKLLAKEKLAQSWLLGVRTNSIRALSIAKTTDTNLATYLDPEIAKTTKDVNDIQKKLENLSSSNEEKSLFAIVSTNRASYIEKRKEVLKLKETHDDVSAQKMIEETMVPALNKYLNSIEDVLTYYDKQIDVFSNTVDIQYNSAQYLVIGIGLFSILIACLIAWRLTIGITKPINFALNLVESVTKGDLREKLVTYKSKDEIGQLVKMLLEMKTSLGNTINEIRQGSDNVAVSSRQIAVGNMDLSSRTEAQAGVLEETASTMEELTATVKQNADNAKEANKLAISASDVAVSGGKIVDDVISTMKEIKDSSHKIVDIIGVIDSIAFQTNILSLNAAVEAARAGEQGRGFAVVASEVRNLAQKSAVAAKEIKALINDSVGKIDQGNTLVNKSGTNMHEIVSSIKNVTTIMNEITLASNEQSIGITQINQAISEIDNVTQQNAALVEEAAAASSSLEEQARNLTGLVSTFTLDQ